MLCDVTHWQANKPKKEGFTKDSIMILSHYRPMLRLAERHLSLHRRADRLTAVGLHVRSVGWARSTLFGNNDGHAARLKSGGMRRNGQKPEAENQKKQKQEAEKKQKHRSRKRRNTRIGFLKTFFRN